MGLYRRKVRRRDGTVGESRCWWGSYYDHCTKRTEFKSTKCVDKKAAGFVLRGWERSSANPSDRPAYSPPLRVALATFLASKRTLVTAGRRAEGTFDMHEQKGAHLARLLGDETPVRSLSAELIDNYVTKRVLEGAAPNTIAKELTTLRGLLKLAHRHGHCAHPSAIMPLDFAAEYKPRERHLGNVLELELLAEELEEGRRAHVLFLVATGARDLEATRAQPSDIDLDHNLVRIHGTKTDKAKAYVPITPITRPLLEAVLREAPGKRVLFRPWSNIRRDLRDACRRACILPLSPNDLRRTFSQWLRKRGVDVSLIAEAMRHADTRMVERVYGKRSAEDTRDLLRHALGAAPADAREESVAMETTGVLTLETPHESVPRGGIEPSTRGFSIQAKRAKKRGWQAEGAPADLRMQGGAPRTFGELIDQALRLGAKVAS